MVLDEVNYRLIHSQALLIECPALSSTRNKHFTASSMKDLSDNVATRNIINFIKESHFYRTI